MQVAGPEFLLVSGSLPQPLCPPTHCPALAVIAGKLKKEGQCPAFCGSCSVALSPGLSKSIHAVMTSASMGFRGKQGLVLARPQEIDCSFMEEKS